MTPLLSASNLSKRPQRLAHRKNQKDIYMKKYDLGMSFQEGVKFGNIEKYQFLTLKEAKSLGVFGTLHAESLPNYLGSISGRRNLKGITYTSIKEASSVSYQNGSD